MPIYENATNEKKYLTDIRLDLLSFICEQAQRKNVS